MRDCFNAARGGRPGRRQTRRGGGPVGFEPAAELKQHRLVTAQQAEASAAHHRVLKVDFYKVAQSPPYPVLFSVGPRLPDHELGGMQTVRLQGFRPVSEGLPSLLGQHSSFSRPFGGAFLLHKGQPLPSLPETPEHKEGQPSPGQGRRATSF